MANERVGQIHRILSAAESLSAVTRVVAVFEGSLKGKQVTIRILDLGSDHDFPQFRYECEVDVFGETGRSRTSGRTPEAAVGTMLDVGRLRAPSPTVL